MNTPRYIADFVTRGVGPLSRRRGIVTYRRGKNKFKKKTETVSEWFCEKNKTKKNKRINREDGERGRMQRTMCQNNDNVTDWTTDTETLPTEPCNTRRMCVRGDYQPAK